MNLNDLVDAFADFHETDQEYIPTWTCPDCGKEIGRPYHACLTPEVAAAYIHDLRDMNARKNERIEKLEAWINKVLNEVEAKVLPGDLDLFILD